MDLSLQKSEASLLLREYTNLQGDWDEAESALQKFVLNLLENDINALYQLLYKIDVDEKKARGEFGADSNSIATGLARLIMQRILQKAETRLKYR